MSRRPHISADPLGAYLYCLKRSSLALEKRKAPSAMFWAFMADNIYWSYLD